MSAEHNPIEMRRHREEGPDAPGDEQKIMSGEYQHEIVKTLESVAHSREDAIIKDKRTRRDGRNRIPEGRPAANPTDIV